MNSHLVNASTAIEEFDNQAWPLISEKIHTFVLQFYIYPSTTFLFQKFIHKYLLYTFNKFVYSTNNMTLYLAYFIKFSDNHVQYLVTNVKCINLNVFDNVFTIHNCLKFIHQE